MEPRLEEEIAVLLRDHGLTIAVAESATGGLVSDLITNVAGSSDYFKGSVVAYDNEIKVKVLGVKSETLARQGAVSHQTAEEMADGIRKLMNASIGLSTTGIAGPAGAAPEKPVGLFYIGIASDLGTKAVEHVFAGDRLQNKKSAAETALIMLREHLLQLK